MEILVASVVLAVALLTLFTVNSSSNQMTLDSYFELMAVQLAQEPIEVFKAVGYPDCNKLVKYPVGQPHSITSENGYYPVEASMFERTIQIDSSKEPLVTISVSVSPKPDSQARNWMRRGKEFIVMKSLIPVYK